MIVIDNQGSNFIMYSRADIKVARRVIDIMYVMRAAIIFLPLIYLIVGSGECKMKCVSYR